MQTKAVAEFAVSSVRTYDLFRHKKESDCSWALFRYEMRRAEQKKKITFRVFSSVSNEPILLFLCRKFEIIVLSATEDQSCFLT